MWMDMEKDWDRVSLAVERLHAQHTEAKRGWVATQGKDLKRTHDPTKAKAIIDARKAAGLWYASEDFPEDEDET